MDSLVIFAGACQSVYKEIMNSGEIQGGFSYGNLYKIAYSFKLWDTVANILRQRCFFILTWFQAILHKKTVNFRNLIIMSDKDIISSIIVNVF